MRAVSCWQLTYETEHRLFLYVHRELKKTRHQTLGYNFTQLLSDFQKFFTSGLSSKYATNACLNFPPGLKHVATLPCEKNAEKWHHSEIHIAINDESQGGIARNLKCDELLYYTFIIHSAGERIFEIGEHLAKV